MTARSFAAAMLLFTISATLTSCSGAPGKPAPGAVVPRPEQVLDGATLYKGNCAGCHGANGRNGAAISLANPVYLAAAGFDNMLRVTADGVPGTLMPGFSTKAGGSLTDAQLAVLIHGMLDRWGKQRSASPGLIPYASHTPGSAAQGQVTFQTFCASCHEVSGAVPTGQAGRVSSIVDPAYLALISDQGLRSIILGGAPEQGMPDSRSDLAGSGARPMTDQEVTDVVAWMGTFRSATPGQVYPNHQ